jgi:hypothetical protein
MIEQTVTLPSPEAVVKRNHIAMMLSERPDSPYAVTGNFLTAYKHADSTARRQFEGDLALVTNIMGVSRLSDLRQPAGRTSTRADIDKRALSIYFPPDTATGRKETKEKQRAEKIERYGRLADAFINSYLRTGVWEPISTSTDLTEEVQSTNDVRGLMLLLFSPGYDQRVQFEAKRKLVLMSLAAATDARSSELKEQDHYPQFTAFLNEHVWHRAPGERVGSTRRVALLSKHAFDDYKTIDVKELETPEDIAAAEKRLSHHKPRRHGYHLRLSELNQRHIMNAGVLIPVFQDSRQKNLLARMGKMIRKGEEDPAIAVQDTTGLMLVARNLAEARKLFRYIASGGNSKSALLKIEELEDTLDGRSEYSAENAGSSSKTRQLKFIARMAGRPIEVVIHTYDSYLDYLHADEVAHEEYEVRRLIDSGAFDLLFPESIYHISRERLGRMIEHQRDFKRRTI